jgi:hypothetical protein
MSRWRPALLIAAILAVAIVAVGSGAKDDTTQPTSP